MNYDFLLQGLTKVVGWEQGYSEANKIEDFLLDSESGLTYQGAHPLMTLDNIRSIMPEDFILQYPQWSADSSYWYNEKVRYEGKVYRAWQELVNVPVGTLPTNTQYWVEFNPLTDFLVKLETDGIKTAIQTFIQIKQLRNETKTLLERRSLFDGAGRLKDTISNHHKLVGFEITPVRSMGVSTRIEGIGLQMTGAVGKVRMYLFHSSQSEPIDVKDLEFTNENGGFQWFGMEEMCLNYFNGFDNTGGSWYLCYNQDELPIGMQAINTTRDWSKEPCGTCMGYRDLNAWREITKYLQVSPFCTRVEDGFTENPLLWDISQNIYTVTQNYGLNCIVSVGCDISPFIFLQRNIFANVIQKQVAATCLRTMAMNPDVRVNRNQSNASKMDILYELDGNTNGQRPAGLGYELKKAYEALSLDTSGLDRICLTCNNGGVKYRTI